MSDSTVKAVPESTKEPADDPKSPVPKTREAIVLPPTGRDVDIDWLVARFNEMPKYLLFFYNLLLDMNIAWRFKEHAFGALRYVFVTNDLVPDDDPAIGRLDDLAFVYRCFAQLVGALPQAKLAIYEEVMRRDQIDIREHLPRMPKEMGDFYTAIAHVYPAAVTEFRVHLGNSIKTGELVRTLQEFLKVFRPAVASSIDMQRCKAFLQSYKLHKLG